MTSYLENQRKANALASTGLAEITEDEVAVHHSRPLKFDPEKHKVLNSEFKYLYTAITRARVNLWFFDEDEDARAPVFEYFRRLDLVKVVSLSENDEGTELPRMFATKSTCTRGMAKRRPSLLQERTVGIGNAVLQTC